MFPRNISLRSTRKRITVAAVVGTSAALLLSLMSGAASAAPVPENPVPYGQGYMGVGYVQDSRDFKPDTGQLHLGARADANLKANPEGIDVSSWQGASTGARSAARASSSPG